MWNKLSRYRSYQNTRLLLKVVCLEGKGRGEKWKLLSFLYLVGRKMEGESKVRIILLSKSGEELEGKRVSWSRSIEIRLFLISNDEVYFSINRWLSLDQSRKTSIDQNLKFFNQSKTYFSSAHFSFHPPPNVA